MYLSTGKQIVLVLLSAGFLATAFPSVEKREDFTSALADVQNSLKGIQGDTKSVFDSLDALKKEVTTGPPSRVGQASKILGSVGSALIKLRSKNAYKIVSGCLDIVAGIATTFGGPVGIGIGAVASLVSSILSLFTGSAMKNSVRAVIDEAMKKYRDQSLQDKAAGAKRDFAESAAFIETLKKQEKITKSDLSILAANVPIYKFSEFLGVLESRIARGAVSTDYAEAARTIDFILLYSQLVVMRETMLVDLSLLYRRPGDADYIADAVDNANKVHRDFAKDALTFLHNLTPENALVATLYYPIDTQDRSKAILAYVKYFGVQSPPERVWNSKYRFQNIYWNTYSICSSAYMSNWMFRSCINLKHPNMKVERLDNGYYTMANRQKKKLYITKHDQGWAWGTSAADPGEQGYLNFIPMKSGNYLISTKKWPNWFLYMESSSNGYIRSWEGNPGGQGLWKLFSS